MFRLVTLWVSMFTVMAGGWLAVMEILLRHPGYGGRTAVAAFIVGEGIASLALLLSGAGVRFRPFIQVGAFGAIGLGSVALFRLATATPFEGFVLVIGIALVIQGAMTLTFSSRRRHARGL